jgi:hypothetical protein
MARWKVRHQADILIQTSIYGGVSLFSPQKSYSFGRLPIIDGYNWL